jgi:phospholipid N-methyltransferase
MSSFLTAYLSFVRAGLLQHAQTGGIIPSQRFLIERMIAPVPEDYRGQVVELGAGTGALTLRLAGRCPEARIVACEINPTLARENRNNFAAAGLAGRAKMLSNSAETLLQKLGQRETPDFIISGVPLGNLGRAKASVLLDTIQQVLSDQGMYVQFQHSLLDRNNIRARFPGMKTTAVLLNFPPAFVYHARKSHS